MPSRWTGQGVSEFVRGRRNRELLRGEPDLGTRCAGAIPSTRRSGVASGWNDSNGPPGPPWAADDCCDGGRDVGERPNRLEIGAIERGGLGRVDLGAPAVADQPGPNERRPSTR